MKWLLKALLQKILSVAPKGEELNYFFQRNITKSLPVSDAKFFQKFSEALKHWKSFLGHIRFGAPLDSNFYEFGAGWDFIIPFAYFAFGIKKQTIIDIRPNIRIDLVNDTISKFLRNNKKLEQIVGKALYTDNFRPLRKKEDLLNYFGINYIAPRDARNTNFPSNSFDFISSTTVFEHIPGSDIPRILKECHRILRPKGIMSCIIDMRDHYSYFDNNISIYNFLMFSDRIWNFINSPLHYQNRLRHPDYINFIKVAGFTILERKIDYPSSDEMEKLKSIKLAARFKKEYSFGELAVKGMHIICRKNSN